MIQLLKVLTEKYVPLNGDEVVDEVFFGGLLDFLKLILKTLCSKYIFIQSYTLLI